MPLCRARWHQENRTQQGSARPSRTQWDMIHNLHRADQAHSAATDKWRTASGFSHRRHRGICRSAAIPMGRDRLAVKPPACAYVDSNPTPATHNPRSGPVCGLGLTCARERFRGPFTVPVGQLRARSGQVSGPHPARPRFRGGGDRASGTAPFGRVFAQLTALLLVSAGSRWVRLSLIACSCVRTPGGRDPAG